MWRDDSSEEMERACRPSQYDPEPWTEEDELFQQKMDDATFQAAIRDEKARQARIEAGIEAVCFSCGCSESAPCPGGCVWATATHCSKCILGYAETKGGPL
jgi:hypothetical protein